MAVCVQVCCADHGIFRVDVFYARGINRVRIIIRVIIITVIVAIIVGAIVTIIIIINALSRK